MNEKKGVVGANQPQVDKTKTKQKQKNNKTN